MMPERLFSTYQVANLLGATPGAVAQWVKNGWLTFHASPDGPPRISRGSLIQFLRQRGADVARIFPEAAVESPSPEAAPVESRPTAEFFAAIPAAMPDQIVDAILADAIRCGAQAFHLTPRREGLALQLRLGGLLHDKVNFARRLPRGLEPKLLAHLMALAGVDPGTPMPKSADFGRFVEGREVRLHLSAVPTIHGPRIVIHLQQPSAAQGLLQLGMDEADRQRIEQILSGGGMVVVAAPRRPGPCGMLRALLAAADTAARSVVAVEKTAGLEVQGAARMRIDPGAGMTYAVALEALNDQDVDVILVGKLRDPLTATAALEAAHDGALVLAGMNVPGAPAAVGELFAMGLEPWPLAAAMPAVIEQAALRMLCEHCKKPAEQGDDHPVCTATGCDHCAHTGYRGEIHLAAVLYVKGEVADAVRRAAPADQIAQAAERAGMKSLRQLALKEIRRGLSSPEELARVLRR
ncbi:MAG: ATPase, T2SS/T4P/T4SS family [Phycisphaerae bacterium]|jgi:general secretion pathway protein E|nr:ATPase, T2SS/T4P/T4SS family [Phycisphaerae bacterium]